MIPIEFATAVALYAGGMTLWVLSFWFGAGWNRAALLTQNQAEEIWQCPICVYLYSEKPDLDLTVCPRCGSYNQKCPPEAEKIGGDDEP